MIKFVEMLTHLSNHVPGPDNCSQTVYVSRQMGLRGGSTMVEIVLMYARDQGFVDVDIGRWILTPKGNELLELLEKAERNLNPD